MTYNMSKNLPNFSLKERYHLREVIIPDKDTELAVELTESAHLNAKSVVQYNRNDTPNATADHLDHSSIHFLNEPAADAIDDTVCMYVCMYVCMCYVLLF